MFHSRFHRPDAIILGFLGVLLLVLATPAAVREILLLCHWSTVEGIREGRPLTIDALKNLDGTMKGEHFFPASYRWENLAARLAARRFDRNAEVAALQRAIRLGPGDSMAWMRLAQNLPAGPDAAHALRLSALTNAFEFDATPRRVDLGLRLWSCMDTDDRQAFGRLVLALWRWERGRLAMVAARRNGYDQIAPYLASTPDQQAVFIRSYAIHRLHPEEPYVYGPP